MYGKYKKTSKFRGKRRMSATKRAYIAGLKHGKAIARGSRYNKRRY